MAPTSAAVVAAAPSPVPGLGRAVVILATSASAALLIGVLTAYSQAWVPEELGSLANSVGPWALVGFSLALLAQRRSVAVMTGGLALLMLLVGYVIGAALSDSSSSRSLIVFWGLAALAAGPVLGLCAHWVRSRERMLDAVGIGAVAGVLVGEGIYGLTVISETTYPPYWRAEIAAGVALLVLVSAARIRSPRALAVGLVTAVIAAGSFVVIYRMDLITLL
jgi:hypothetical protein